MAIKTTYTTSDNKIFTNLQEAEAHETSLIDMKKLKVDTIEKLNEILILLAPASGLKDSYLDSVKDVVALMLLSDTTPEYILEQYYNSNCY